MDQNCGIFISNVERSSKAYEGGLKRGDQILEVNNSNFENISHNKALEVLRGTTLLSITVKSNLLGKFITNCLYCMHNLGMVLKYITVGSINLKISMYCYTISKSIVKP